MEERLLALLRLALKQNASDIHFDLKYDVMTISLRVNGIIRKVKAAPGDEKLLRYLQYLSNLDIGNRLKPQTGQFEMEVDGVLLSLRFAIVNTVSLSNGVLRILNGALPICAESLSNKEEQNRFLNGLSAYDNGLILFGGPTGSGKTTTLYTLLSNVKGKVIYSLEDPIEVYHECFVQIQINEKQGLDYESGIAQILRHDPDIIMIGEIRDEKAARMALRAADTGHLVFATIHASSASMIISRMTDLGVKESFLYEMLVAMSYQRMIINRSGEKEVLYEIMDRKEIEYFHRKHEHSSSFLSVEKQFELGRSYGIY